ncbi:T9SS type A sorting domain-containing protein [Aureivirga sp. CE67]|uniref:T9SS type A sorting domain-containing protein n=1 Tax=Aureivirga sp. CE67 TaxID=1788983 RepID=UPI0018C97679|nr:T9SS type A sorting domain-containing protein [Aureivirga sp. CE67]
MKKLLLPVMLIASTLSFSQSIDAPVRRAISAEQNESDFNFNQRVAELDAYWESVPSDFKGSGVKVYERWKENWRYRVNPDGTLFSAEQIAEAWKNVQDMKSYRRNENTGQWIPLGPFSHSNVSSWSPGQGRVNITVVDPNNPNTLYVGTPDGGMWKSTDHGENWEAMTDYLPSIGVSGIAVDYNDSDTIYISTGDEDASDSLSDGVYKSTDGGQTWDKLASLGGFTLSGEILINPEDSNMLWVCTNQGLYKTSDAGQSWVRVVLGNVKEIRLKPNDPNTVYVVLNSANSSSVLKSTNAGDSFEEAHSQLLGGRTAIAVTPANENIVYALYSNQNETFKGLYKSEDSGDTFSLVHSPTDSDIYDGSQQAFYDLAITVSDTNENEVFVGNLNIFKSINGGQSFFRMNAWNQPTLPSYTHADIHDLKFYNGKFYASTDGGIYISENAGTSFENKTFGLNISQFYRVDVAPETSSKIAGGLQDNGGFAFSNNSWKVYHGADGMDAAIDPTDSNYYFGFLQFGQYLSVYDVENNNGGGIANSPNNIAGDWITPLEFGNEGTLYAGYNRLYKLEFNEAQSEYQFVQVSKDPNATSTGFTKNLSIIRVNPEDDNKLLISDEYKLYKSNPSSLDSNGRMSFTAITSPVGGQYWGNFITNFDYNQDNPNIIYVTTRDAVYKSINGGASWTNITFNLPTNGVSNVTIAHQKDSKNNTVYLAQNNAIYYMDDTADEWILYNHNLPHTAIRDLEINSVENHLVIATYGRGIWRASVVETSLDVEDVTDGNSSDLAKIYPNPIQTSAKISIDINEKASLKVYDLTGKEVLNRNYSSITSVTNLDFSSLSSGNYILRIVSEKHLVTKKIIIRK